MCLFGHSTRVILRHTVCCERLLFLEWLQPRIGFRCRACVIPASSVISPPPAASATLASSPAAAALPQFLTSAVGSVQWLGVPDSRSISSATTDGVDARPSSELLGGVASFRVAASAISTVMLSLIAGGGVYCEAAKQTLQPNATSPFLLRGDADSWTCGSGAGPVQAAQTQPPSLSETTTGGGGLRSSGSRSPSPAAALLLQANAAQSDIPSKGVSAVRAAGVSAPSAAAAAAAAASFDDEPLPLPPLDGGYEGAGYSLSNLDPSDFSGSILSLPCDIGGQLQQRRLLCRTTLGPDMPAAAEALSAALLATLGRPHAGALQTRY